MTDVTNLIVGCGLSGLVVAERLANVKKEEVLIIDKREHIAGNIYDYKDCSSHITVHKYGPHIFHTNNEEVWRYLSQFTDWHRFMLRVKAVIEGKEVNIPFNLDSLSRVFPTSLARRLEEKLLAHFSFNQKVPILELKQNRDPDLSFLAQYVYEKVFLGYTLKQWGVSPEELSPSVSGRVPVLISRDDRYFQDKYQAIPQAGYTAMAKKMLASSRIRVELGTDFNKIKKNIRYKRLFFTGPIDEFFDYQFGALPYRSLNFVFKTYPVAYFQSGPQINFPNNYDYTRSVEYKYFLGEQSEQTIVSYEYPQAFENGKNERFYPIPHPENQIRFARYATQAKTLKNVWFLGRLADYKYYNMDETVARALSVFGEL